MGALELPDSVYYGAGTERARLNFPISRSRFGRDFIRSLGLIKKAAAETNADLGLLDRRLADAISEAAASVADGKFDNHFVVDVFQTGSGTSTNMNTNEVIANVAIEKLGGVRGSRDPIHPNDHVNKCQSSNDVIPTAIHITAAQDITDHLLPAMSEIETALEAKSKQFWDVIKTGRTHLQDATPIRLGQEFGGYAGQISESTRRVSFALEELRFVALGGTAVGTGIGSHPEFAGKVIERLNNATGLNLRETINHFHAQATIDSIVMTSGVLRTFAVSLLKIANDIRWLGSGPRAGIGEIYLPEVQPGSSIMPGKINPVIAESAAMACAQVIGNDAVIVTAGQAGVFELNTMLPVAARNILESISLLTTSCSNLTKQCINGLMATDRGPAMVERGLAICTALAPVIGYDATAAIAKEAAEMGKTIREVAEQRTALTSDELYKILDPTSMTEPNPAMSASGG